MHITPDILEFSLWKKSLQDALHAADAALIVSRRKKLLRCSLPSEFISKINRNYSWDLVLKLGLIAAVLCHWSEEENLWNKTKYIRLRRYDEVWWLSEFLLNALWVLLTWVWAQKMKIESLRQTRPEQTNEQTPISISWAPIGAKKLHSLTIQKLTFQRELNWEHKPKCLWGLFM